MGPHVYIVTFDSSNGLKGSLVRLSELYREIFFGVSCSATDDEVAIRETVVIHRDEAKVDTDEGVPGVATSRSADGAGTLNALADARHAAKKRDTFSFIVAKSKKSMT